jgi:hypothetical protein
MKKNVGVLYEFNGSPMVDKFTEFKADLFGVGTTPAIVMDKAVTTGVSVTGATTTGVLVTGNATDAFKTLTGTFTRGINIGGTVATGISIGSTSVTAIDITACAGRAIRVGTKGTTYANSTALQITSIGGVLDTDPARNYLVGVFTKVSGDESAAPTDDLGCAWFRNRIDKGATTPAGYSVYGVKSQLRIYADTALATSVSNWAAAGMLGVLEVSGATTTFASGCIAAAVYGNVALSATSVIASGAIVAAVVACGASAAITNTGKAYYGVHIEANTVAFDAGIHFGATLTHALQFATSDKTAGAYVAEITFDAKADGMIKIDVAGTDYYIPFWNAAGLDNEWAD